jgi:hypothetical protein
MKTRFSRARTAVTGQGGTVFALILLASLALTAQTNLPPPPEGPPPTPPPQIPVTFSPGMAAVVKLAQAGVTKDVLLAYVTSSAISYHPTPDEIIYLNDLGVADEVIAALVKKPAAMADGANPAPAAPPPGAPDATQPPSIASSPAPAAIADPPAAPIMAPVAPPAQPGPVAPPQNMAPPPPPSDPPAYPGLGQVPIDPPPGAPPGDMTGDDSAYFYDSLAPYGSWVTVPDCGLCWQPTTVVLNPVWRPYYDHGHWVYTDSGWFWQSGYSWGWAPFHYGRWLPDHRFGWVWSPGRVWAPAWVSWRYSRDYCGWAPLPPSAGFALGVGFSFHGGRVGIGFDFGIADNLYAFVPAGHFVDRDFHRFVAPAWQARGLYQSSSVLNNYRAVGRTVVNEGVGRDWVAQAGRVNIQTVHLRDQASASISARAGGVRSEALAVYRPEVRPGARPVVSSPPLAGRAAAVASPARTATTTTTAAAQARYQQAVKRMNQRANTPAPGNGGFGQSPSAANRPNAPARVAAPQTAGQAMSVPRPQTPAPAASQYRRVPAYTPPSGERPASSEPAARTGGYQQRGGEAAQPAPAQGNQQSGGAPQRTQGGRGTAPGNRN